jgi:hypothetical protein
VSEDDQSVPVRLLVDIEDRLFRVLELDVWERCIYYHLLRLSRASGAPAVQIALAPAARATGMSEDKIRRSIRSMAVKGCVRIEDRGKNGHLVRLLLPEEIETVRASATVEEALDLDDIDFYADRRYLSAILHRENGECFYCARAVNEETAALDHVVPVVEGGDNSHRNVVAACHECNSLKQATAAEDFIRRLYRSGLLSQGDVTARLDRLRLLRGGELLIDVGLRR